jgi:hypothetical protein
VKNAEKADDEYKKSVEKLKNMESRFYDSEMPQILNVRCAHTFGHNQPIHTTKRQAAHRRRACVQELQTMEEARVAMMKTSFNSFVTAQAAVHPAIKSACETMSSVRISPPSSH